MKMKERGVNKESKKKRLMKNNSSEGKTLK